MAENDWRLFVPVAGAAALATFAGLQPFVDPRLLFLDPAIAGVVSGECCRSWYGFMSTLGVLIWIAAGAVTLFAGVVMKRYGVERVIWRMLVLAGLISLCFGVDDVYLIHENVAPKLGVPQIVVLVAYAFAAAIYIDLSWRRILAFNPVLFLAAGGFLAGSLAIDQIAPAGAVATIAFEDGFKFVGIVAWATFHLGFVWHLFVAAEDRVADDHAAAETAGLAMNEPAGARAAVPLHRSS